MAATFQTMPVTCVSCAAGLPSLSVPAASRSSAMSPMSLARRVASFVKQRRSTSTTRAGVVDGSDVQSGSRSRIGRNACPRPSAPRMRRRPVSISYSTQPNAQMSVRLSTGLPARLLGAHVGGGPEDGALARAADGHRRRLRQIRCRPSLGRRLREPEVEHLDDALGRDLDVGRLQIPVDDPLLVRRVERVRDLPRDRQRLVQRRWARAQCGRPASRPRPVPTPAPGSPSASSSRRSRRCGDD